MNIEKFTVIFTSAGPALVTTKLDPATPSRAAKEDVSLSLVSDGLKSGAGKRGTLSSSVSKLLEQVREVEAQEKKRTGSRLLLERVNEFRSQSDRVSTIFSKCAVTNTNANGCLSSFVLILFN